MTNLNVRSYLSISLVDAIMDISIEKTRYDEFSHNKEVVGDGGFPGWIPRYMSSYRENLYMPRFVNSRFHCTEVYFYLPVTVLCHCDTH